MAVQSPSNFDGNRPLKIVLISPKGPLYRHRGGIFRQSLRYMPLTFPTLKALIPPDIPAEVLCIDEGTGDVDLNLSADLIGMTVITGTALRAYELSRHFRARGIPVVLGGPHITLVPDDAQPHADSLVVGYAEEEWPRLLLDFIAGRLQPRYTQSPTLKLEGYPLPDRSVLPSRNYLTTNVFEATRGCIHDCSFCVVPSAWGRRPFQKPVEEITEDIKRQHAKRAIFVDLNLIADKQYAAKLFEALIPLKVQWYGLATTLLCEDLPLLDLVARSGCRGLLMGLESISPTNLRENRKPFNHPDQYMEVVEKLHQRKISLQGCFVFGLDDDTPDVFLKTARFAVKAKIDL
ncbi:MAG: radical SAM protein, partial [Planctomycetaceae bacterium]|nr:radical SAM protein [Planctomycetaceae bacterium]